MQKLFFNIFPDFTSDAIMFVIKYLFPLFLMFFILILCIFFIFKIIKNYKELKNYQKNLNMFEQELQTQALKEIWNLHGKELIKWFLNYLEKIYIKDWYKDIWEILLKIWFLKQDVQNIKNIIYKDEWNITQAEQTIKNFLNNKYNK